MDFLTLFIGLLFISLIYLHIKQSDLIFQHDIKIAKTLAMILLCVLAVSRAFPSVTFENWDRNAILFWAFVISATVWVLSILVFWKILSGCQKDAFFKRIGKPGQSLREKIKDLILEVIEKNRLTPEFKFFIATRFEDSVIDSISDECRSIGSFGNYMNDETAGAELPPKDIEKLKALAEQLG